jgi:ADP-ribose pyrophosphatase
MTSQVLQPWTILSEHELLSRPPFIKVSVQRIGLPDGRVIEDYYQITLPDVVSIFAETADGYVLVQRGYRHGPRRVCLTFPGGMISPGEAALLAARRELLEETGFEATDWQLLGSFVTQANQRGQIIHYFRAVGCRRVADPYAADLEEAEILQLTREELLTAKNAGDLPILTQAALLALATGCL